MFVPVQGEAEALPAPFYSFCTCFVCFACAEAHAKHTKHVLQRGVMLPHKNRTPPIVLIVPSPDVL